MNNQNLSNRKLCPEGKPLTHTCRCRDCVHWQIDVNLKLVGVSGIPSGGYCELRGLYGVEDPHFGDRLCWCINFYGYKYTLIKP